MKIVKKFLTYIEKVRPHEDVDECLDQDLHLNSSKLQRIYIHFVSYTYHNEVLSGLHLNHVLYVSKDIRQLFYIHGFLQFS